MGTVQFLGIGAPRSGSSWLHNRLIEHGGFELPPVKEVHYFDRHPMYSSPSRLHQAKLTDRIKQYQFLKSVTLGLGISAARRNWPEFRWKLKWFFSDYNDEWYLGLFDNPDAISGEITPAYSILKRQDIAKVQQLLPEIKIVYLIRNPVERTWSSYRKAYLREGRSIAGEDELKRYLIGHDNAGRSRYLDNVDRFLEFYPGERILIGFYDAITLQPQQLLTDIVSFLGGDTTVIESRCKLGTVNNSSPGLAMPEGIAAFLSDYYRDDMVELASRWGAYCSSWIAPEQFSAEQLRELPATFHPHQRIDD